MITISSKNQEWIQTHSSSGYAENKSQDLLLVVKCTKFTVAAEFIVIFYYWGYEDTQIHRNYVLASPRIGFFGK